MPQIILPDTGLMNIYDENSAHRLAEDTHSGKFRGYSGRNYDAHPYGAMPWENFPVPVIPRSEWSDRIKECNAKKLFSLHHHQLQKVPIMNQARTNYCFPAGTMIRMADGSQKPIELIATRDQVLTAEGNIGKVRATSVRSVSEELCRIVMYGHRHLRSTDEHPYLTKRGYVAAKDLVPGDLIRFPKFMPETMAVLQTGEYLFELNRVKQSRRKYREYSLRQSVSSIATGIPGKSQMTRVLYEVPDMVSMTVGLGRIFGLYVAEGHTSPNAVHWSFNASESDTLGQELVELIFSELGAVAHKKIRNNVCQVTVYSTRLSKLMDAWFGRGSDRKSLHRDITAGPKPFLEAVLFGWMDGDRKQGNSAVTVSRTLALNMFDIANALGLQPTLTTHQYPKTGKDGSKRKHSWMVGWSPNATEHYTHTDDEAANWKKVKEIERQQFKGDVFNFSVEGDNSYVAEGVAVHNCWINSVVGAIMNARARNGYPTVNLSSASAGAPGKKYKNVGGWTGEAIGYIGKYGLATHASWGNAVIDPSLFAPTRGEAKLYGIGQWWELRSKRFDEIATCLLLGFDVVVGLQWWGHSVRYNALVEIGRNAFGVVAVNSWGPDWESGGMTVLAESKANADEANCITTGKPSGDSAAKLKADVDRLRAFADQLEIEG